jgi:hypothetical protein
MMPEYAKEGMGGMPEYAKEGMGGLPEMGEGMMNEGGEGGQQGWYRHASAGPSQTQGQWNANFEMPAWGAPPDPRAGNR